MRVYLKDIPQLYSHYKTLLNDPIVKSLHEMLNSNNEDDIKLVKNIIDNNNKLKHSINQFINKSNYYAALTTETDFIRNLKYE